ncbi:MAG TPA: hypothetical protein VLZ10_11945, partial [Thermodesulfobacteriota bacterium]|nr:hypothetical protein [Thermodesulfobacteriota bacterium]
NGAGKKKEHKEKKPYFKPEVKQVPLRPEEAVLGFCKSASIAGPLSPTCSAPIPCSSTGS